MVDITHWKIRRSMMRRWVAFCRGGCHTPMGAWSYGALIDKLRELDDGA